MDNLEINKVHDFWNSESCGERYALGDSNVEKFFPIGLFLLLKVEK